ncbi:hypothetical protein LXA43DRAFT_890644 [Ganoderma leucocontextum]|nr:hypothetical protein LXA43DRAFT_890644 [Ganoderma leucocontextum]
MPSKDETKCSISLEQLFALGHGYPLWHPDIERVRGLDVKIGDVGYLHDGTFIRIFNATLSADHPDRKMLRVPDGHKPFRTTFRLKHMSDSQRVVESPSCSRSLGGSAFGLELGASAM